MISHNHYDHLDAPTVRTLPRDTPVVAPGGLGRWFRWRGFTAVTELDWWESAHFGALRVTFVPAHHWSRRGLFDHCATLWGGWVLTVAGGPRLYHAGDSAHGPGGGRAGCPGRRHPGSGAHALGTFRLSREPALEPIERTQAAWIAAGRDRADLWDLAVGESRPLPTPPAGRAPR